MEFKSKVFINPNFKGNPQTSTGPLQYKTAYVNRHFSQETYQNQVHQPQDDVNNRKIYVNPNFIAPTNHHQPYDNVGTNVSHNYIGNLVPNMYSVSNIEQKHSFINDNLEIKNSFYSIRLSQNTGEPSAKENLKVTESFTNSLEAPLTKSRYSLVRKSKPISKSIAITSNSYKDNTIQNTHNVLSHASTSCCMTAKVVNSYCQKLNLTTKVPQKVTKIKVSKYKTVPISSYLKVSSQVSMNNKIKQPPSLNISAKVQGRGAKICSSFVLDNKNRYKFVKSKVSVSIVDNVKQTPMKFKKNVSLNNSKITVGKAKFKVNNIPCRLFTKYGKCLRKDYGKCEFLHDKKHVSLCRKFIKGICHDGNCTLSHELSTKKMPTCYFYLRGMCTKQNCPYLHVKLNEKTKICQDFVKGYCEKGDNCPFRHVKVQESKTTRKIKLKSGPKNQQSKGKKLKDIQSKIVDRKNVNKSNEEETDVKDKSDSDHRYYDDVVNNEGTCEIIKPTRCKLGVLPSYIQL